MTVNELKSKKVAELKTLARNAGIDGYDAMKKAELVEALAVAEEPAAEAPAAEKETTDEKGRRTVVPDKDDGRIDFDLNGFTDRIFNEFIEEKLGRVTSGIDIAAVVEDKINQMDVREFEQLVLSVMKKELQAVVNLGALIGFVIGLINLIVL